MSSLCPSTCSPPSVPSFLSHAHPYTNWVVIMCLFSPGCQEGHGEMAYGVRPAQEMWFRGTELNVHVLYFLCTPGWLFWPVGTRKPGGKPLALELKVTQEWSPLPASGVPSQGGRCPAPHPLEWQPPCSPEPSPPQGWTQLLPATNWDVLVF